MENQNAPKKRKPAKVQIKSIFEQIANEIFNIKDVKVVKETIINFVNSKNINEKDKIGILRNIESLHSKNAIDNYICNALLKYEGLGYNRF
jgi:hypothetical protein